MNDEHTNSSVRSLQGKLAVTERNIVDRGQPGNLSKSALGPQQERCRRYVVGNQDHRSYNTGNRVKTLL